MSLSRREFLRASGALVVSFSVVAAPAVGRANKALPSPSLRNNPTLSAWIRLDADGAVHVSPGKCEIGQGIGTALSQIVADELDVSFDRVHVRTVDTDHSPNESYTFGSLSVQHSGSAFRHAAAELRYILTGNAASRLGVDPARLAVSDGRFRLDDKPIDLAYADLLSSVDLDVDIGGEVNPKPLSQLRIVGRSESRKDLPAKVFGQPAYIQDMRPHDMLHARVVRARSQDFVLDGFDDRKIASLPGVTAVVRDGSFIAVVSDREEQAIDAANEARRIATWKPVRSPIDDSLSAHDLRGSAADVAVVHRTDPGDSIEVRELVADYSKPAIAHASMSPSAALAHWDDDRLTVWSHGQGMFPLRAAIATVVRLPVDRVRLVHAEASGCYGHNGADDAACDAAIIAMRLPGKTIRLQWSREDEFRYEPLGTPMSIRLSAGLDEAGRVTRWHHDVWSATHSSRPGGVAGAGNLRAAREIEASLPLPPPRNLSQPTGGGDRNAVPLYAFDDLRVTKHFLKDTPRTVSALRGLGAFANVFAIESFIDELAELSGTDPVDFRIAHMQDPRAIRVLEAMRDSLRTEPENRDGFLAGRGLGFARYKNLGAYAAVVCEVHVDTNSGLVLVSKAHSVVDAGLVINPAGVENQIEGGIVQSTSWTLKERMRLDIRQNPSEQWSSYPILSFNEAPVVTVELLESQEASLGAGEASQGPTAAAIANGFRAATGIRLRDLPFSPETVVTAFRST